MIRWRGTVVLMAAVAVLLPVTDAVDLTTALAQTGPATITLDPRAAQVGSTVTVDGEGFSAPGSGEFVCGDVDIIFDAGDGGDPQVVATVTPEPGPTGHEFTTDFIVPDRPAGRYVVEAVQRPSATAPACRRADSNLDVFTFAVTPDSGPAGSTATAEGAGFPDAVECGPVEISFDGDPVAQVETTGFPGEPFSAPFTVPNRPPGTYDVVALQEGCGTYRGTDTFTIPEPTEPPRPDATLTLDPVEGPIETETRARGAGFDPSRRVILSFGTVRAATVPPGRVGGGTFAVDLTVPEGVPGGEVTVTACQRCGTPGERAATATFLVTPRLEVDPAVSPPGRVVLATGDGFPAATAVRLTWQPGVGAATATTGEDGTLRAPVQILPRDQSGPRELAAALDETPDEIVVTVPLVVVPGTVQPGDFAVRR